MIKLGVNIDHVATLRQARGGINPSVIEAAKIVNLSGAHGVTMHLREDRRHIQDTDIFSVREIVPFLNMEMAIVPEIIGIALKVKPNICCLVPEKRQELTTEGGLNVTDNISVVKNVVGKLQSNDISVSLFIDPDERQIDAARETGAQYIELHTGEYANAATETKKKELLNILNKAAKYAQNIGLNVNAGHGLDYNNVKQVKDIAGLQELNIGHSIISRAIFVGLEKAICQMLEIINN